jgi:3-hydroxyacyl-CoA dehydrogenase
MKINAVTRYELDGSTGVVTIDSPPVNALSAAVRAGIADAMARAQADPAVQSIVILCAGRTFFAGADITELASGPAKPTLRDVQALIEGCAKPVITAIHGTALGGGLELALVAHYRIAVPSARFGLPEVNLGLVPGAGGTQRLPRIVGAEKALEMIALGTQIRAPDALASGLVDQLAAEGALRADAVQIARDRAASGGLPRVRDREDRIAEARERPQLFDEFRSTHSRRFRGFLAPEFAIRCVEAAVHLPFEEGLRNERRMFEDLVAGTQSAAQRHVFFAERQAAKPAELPTDLPGRTVERVGIVGAGLMGAGISINFLNAGLPVTLVEVAADALERGLQVIRGHYEDSVRKGKLAPAELERRLGLLTGSLVLADLAPCDLVIEAIVEQLEIKRDLFTRLDSVVREDAILASNTSYLNIDDITRDVRYPQNIVGLHFFSPANVMRLVEIVRCAHTSNGVIATCFKLAKTLGKVGVLVGNGHGFVGNRMLAPRQREAEKLILEGAMPWDVDRVLYDFGLPMGPFQMRDLAGMDLGWDPAKSSSSTVREILNEMGRRGQKTQAGYYDYDANRRPKPSPIVEQVILDFAARKGIERRVLGDQEILERCLYPLINEGARILEEGKAARASDIDIVWVVGYGWPAYRGGPLFWADLEGLPRILGRLQEWRATHGDDFRPAALLERLVAEERGFSSL